MKVEKGSKKVVFLRNFPMPVLFRFTQKWNKNAKIITSCKQVN